jgi:hypothetical protein
MPPTVPTAGIGQLEGKVQERWGIAKHKAETTHRRLAQDANAGSNTL